MPGISVWKKAFGGYKNKMSKYVTGTLIKLVQLYIKVRNI